MLLRYRDQRNEVQEKEDANAVEQIQSNLMKLNEDINSLVVFADSLGWLMGDERAFQGMKVTVRIVAGNTDAGKLWIWLTYSRDDSQLVFGRDGRKSSALFRNLDTGTFRHHRRASWRRRLYVIEELRRICIHRDLRNIFLR